MSSRILLTTFGSLGDLHPFLALATELKSRGHHVSIATSETYRANVEAAGVRFFPVRPDLPTADGAPAFVARVMDLKTGTAFLTKRVFMPSLRDSYHDLWEASTGVDLIVTHPVTMAGPLVAQKRNLPWVSTALAPISLPSLYDPPVPPIAPDLAMMYRLGAPATRITMLCIRAVSYSWLKPFVQFRTELGLPNSGHPFFEGQQSPYQILALFSPVLVRRHDDWPPQTLATGFPWFAHTSTLAYSQTVPADAIRLKSGCDRIDATQLSPALKRFLGAGSPPIVFTLGSSAVMNAGDFYRVAVQAARLLGRRAVLLAGPAKNVSMPLSTNEAAFEYAPHAALFPQALVVVHQGGIGTTGEAMRAGAPQLVVPYSHDQPDNAARVTRLKIARTLPRSRFTVLRLKESLFDLIGQEQYKLNASRIGDQVRSERGTELACDAIERVLNSRQIKC